MICVSIGRTRHEMMIAEQHALFERRAKLLELRIDWLKKSPDLPRLLKDRPVPTVVTCRRPADQGRWAGSEEQRLGLLRQAIIEGAEYVDLEEDAAKRIPRHGDTQRIVSYHDFSETPDNIDEIHRRLADCDADVVKIVTTALHPSDNVRMLNLVRRASIPTVGFCMGELGLLSRVLCGRYGAPFTYASFSQDRVMAPGQVSFDQMQHEYFYERITAKTQLFGVMGDPIGHSKSPRLHNQLLRDSRLDAVYLPLLVPKGSFASAFADYATLGFDGFSVTIPHKEEAVRAAARADDDVMQIGASNTLYRDGSQWVAANTDYTAALSSLVDAIRETDPDATVSGKRAIILGSGGVARAVAVGLIRSGALVTITGRTRPKAEKLAAEIGCHIVSWENRSSETYEVVVNCTPVGMHPNVDETPFPDNAFSEHGVAFDTIYTPENTLFLKQARSRGCLTVSGLEMFVRQAAAQFELFTGLPASLPLLRRDLRREISAARLPS
ncbi:shikimate dehydrogenase [Stratiformator vulcanicus]|uniref:Multifunctional fusion protein n=1 Tax=Stratiformator vulcanicus TaxID=2527980 RepID=A0A517R2J0_9PLAN|nr:shikimate dehydrogenase [Stratiformator vulcanicus]QDT38106.1 Shikimate dehydrogenase [Stratiformator vulcanicus]